MTTMLVWDMWYPAPKKHIVQGLSPLHARCMDLFDSLVHEFHKIVLDNLYMSAKLSKAEFNHTKKVLIAGVARKGMRGIPACVMEDEVKQPKDLLAAQGTVKAAVLMGDPECLNLAATSVYNTKPVHFLSMSCGSIKWILKTRDVYCVDTQKFETIQFLRLNINDDYNAGMGHMVVSNQLRNYYQMNHWLQNQKWWL